MIEIILRGKKLQFKTKPGLFSKNEIDVGSRMLIDNVDVSSSDTVLDLGCGYGAIGLALASEVRKVYMVDIDIRAVKYSVLNAELNGLKNVEIIASDGFEEVPKEIQFDVVVSNPPTHQPKEALVGFIHDAYTRLNAGGRLYFVTEKRISPMIRREVERVFDNYKSVASGHEFIVCEAIK